MCCSTYCPQPCIRPPLTRASTGDSQTLMGKSGSVPCGGHCSFLLGPGVHGVLFGPSKSLFPQPCVSYGSSIVGLMVTSPRKAYATPRSASPRALTPVGGHCWPIPHQETLRHSSVSVSVGSLGPRVHKVCLSPLSIYGGDGVWF